MACFLVSAAEAAIVTVAAKIAEKKENEPKTVDIKFDGEHVEKAVNIPFSKKLKWLSRLLWGGSALLAFEHVWHGEVAPYFPFLTAMNDPGETKVMLHEMATTGVAMAALVTVVWIGMLIASHFIEKKAIKEAKDAEIAKD